MDLLINNVYIPYYHMDAIQSTFWGHTYVVIAEYLVAKIWIATTMQHPDSILINGLKANIFTKFFPRVGWYKPKGVGCHYIVVIVSLLNNSVITVYSGVGWYTPEGVACHCIVAIVSLLNNFVTTVYPSLYTIQ